MKMQLRLSGNFGKFLDNAEYIKVDNQDLTIEIVTSFGYNTTLYAKLNNGVEEKSIKLNGKSFTIENDYLNVGQCLLKIVAMVGNRKVGEYACPPILVVDIDNEKMVVDKLAEFDIKIQNFLKEYQADKEYMRFELNRMQKTLKELIIAE